MTTEDDKQECVEDSDKIKQCLNFEHCHGFVGCAIDSVGKIIRGYRTKEGLCFDCNHWQELVDMNDQDILCLRVEGRHYQCSVNSMNKPPGKYAGFAGRKFIVKMKDVPLQFYTCDMWTQGTIPEHFKDRLPDNAEFLNEVTERVVYDGEQFITAFDIKPIEDQDMKLDRIRIGENNVTRIAKI